MASRELSAWMIRPVGPNPSQPVLIEGRGNSASPMLAAWDAGNTAETVVAATLGDVVPRVWGSGWMKCDVEIRPRPAGWRGNASKEATLIGIDGESCTARLVVFDMRDQEGAEDVILIELDDVSDRSLLRAGTKVNVEEGFARLLPHGPSATVEERASMAEPTGCAGI